MVHVQNKNHTNNLWK